MTSIAHRPHGGELTSPTPIEEGNQGRGNHIMSEQRPDPIGARTRQRAHGTSAASAIESDREKVTEVERLTRPHPVGSRSAGDRPSNPDLSNGASESVTTARAGARDTTTHEQRRRERRQTPRPRRTPPPAVSDGRRDHFSFPNPGGNSLPRRALLHLLKTNSPKWGCERTTLNAAAAYSEPPHAC